MNDPFFQSAGFDVIIIPKGSGSVGSYSLTPFGSVWVRAKNFDFSKPVKIINVLPGIGQVGDGSYNALLAMISHPMFWNQSQPLNPCLLNAVLNFNVVLGFVQTASGDTAYMNGEIDFIQTVSRQIYKTIGKNGLLAISLGGYGSLQWMDSVSRAAMYSKAVFISPGGGGSIAGQFPALAVEGKLDCLFFHSVGDPTASIKQSVIMNSRIKALGGNSELVQYDNAVHVLGFPMNAYFPPRGWVAYNDSNYKLVKGSFVPVKNIYDFILEDAGPIIEDKLLLTQQILRRADGSVYAKTV